MSATLSTTATHAIRALICLATGDSGRATLGGTLAERAHVPPTYLAKILATLGRAGILRGSRGMKGGYRLTRDPASIRLLEVVEILDGPQTTPTCFLNPLRPCSERQGCKVYAEWRRVREAFVGFLSGTTIADLVGDPAWCPGEGGARDRTA